VWGEVYELDPYLFSNAYAKLASALFDVGDGKKYPPRGRGLTMAGAKLRDPVVGVTGMFGESGGESRTAWSSSSLDGMLHSQ